jgi:hypothetical protein
MVVEHAFITTLEAPDALRAASQFLAARGFEAANQGAFALGPDGWNSLEMTRGKKSANRAKSVVELPQRIRVEWDRGRVSVAASATSLEESRMTALSKKVKGRPAKMMESMLVQMVTQLQHLLETRSDPAELGRSWAEFEQGLHHEDRTRRRKRIIWAVVIVSLAVGGLITVIVIAANSK